MSKVRAVMVGDDIYPTATDAARAIGCSRPHVARHIKSGKPLADGRIVRFADGGGPNVPLGDPDIMDEGKMTSEACFLLAQAYLVAANNLVEKSDRYNELGKKIATGEALDRDEARIVDNPMEEESDEPIAVQDESAEITIAAGGDAVIPAPEEPRGLARDVIDSNAILVNGNQFDDIQIAADEMEYDADELMAALAAGQVKFGEHRDDIGMADPELESARVAVMEPA